MDLNEKFEINRKFKNLRDYLERLVIFGEEKDEDIIELHLKAEDIWNKVSYPLNQVENEYAFFNSLHRQTKYDNIISLIKICERLNNVERLDIDKSKIVSALRNESFSDVEDCLQAECAAAFSADYIVTRNIKNFENSEIPAIMPDKFLEMFKQ